MTTRSIGPRIAIAKRLRQAREDAGLTQAEVAIRAGLKQSAVSHAESGRREPLATTLAALCRAIEVSADWVLLGRRSSP